MSFNYQAFHKGCQVSDFHLDSHDFSLNLTDSSVTSFPSIFIFVVEFLAASVTVLQKGRGLQIGPCIQVFQFPGADGSGLR